jgi:hypothetical protein
MCTSSMWISLALAESPFRRRNTTIDFWSIRIGHRTPFPDAWDNPSWRNSVSCHRKAQFFQSLKFTVLSWITFKTAVQFWENSGEPDIGFKFIRRPVFWRPVLYFLKWWVKTCESMPFTHDSREPFSGSRVYILAWKYPNLKIVNLRDEIVLMLTLRNFRWTRISDKMFRNPR